MLYLFLRENEHEQGRDRERGETEDPKEDPGSELSAQSRTRECKWETHTQCQGGSVGSVQGDPTASQPPCCAAGEAMAEGDSGGGGVGGPPWGMETAGAGL